MYAPQTRLVCLLVAIVACPPLATAATPKGLPKFDVIERAVHAHFATLEGYETGDLITRTQAKKALDKVTSLGWKVPSESELLEKVLADDDFLVVEFQSTGGRKFMRQISKYRNAYDRVDNLSKLPRGKTQVKDLIKTTDGYKMIEYLTSTSGGKNMGKMLTTKSKSTDFNKPTGRIYTAELLVAALRDQYAKVTNSP
jgi:hypothetical protein